ncbi:BlaI/MecI/CopY family transcriptional regulator [Gimesia algae]|uniref:Penicillinase repressor n=1 Tax=Gimesia algae TaxID=2527971 RepID=A0A517VAB7_9PLAN|nr:BlaI/MecI/CopY family transcriptional regulator [Gimesia algae]QDT89928.1 Penicillinase repressor [Gimesia algae]
MVSPGRLSRRERQIMDIIYRIGRGTVQEVLVSLDNPPSYSSIRATMRLLEEKGHLKHISDGPRYVYLPTRTRNKARKSALRHMLDTFFNNSIETTVATLLDMKSKELTDEELDRIQILIDEARKHE